MSEPRLKCSRERDQICFYSKQRVSPRSSSAFFNTWLQWPDSRSAKNQRGASASGADALPKCAGGGATERLRGVRSPRRIVRLTSRPQRETRRSMLVSLRKGTAFLIDSTLDLAPNLWGRNPIGCAHQSSLVQIQGEIAPVGDRQTDRPLPTFAGRRATYPGKEPQLKAS